MNKPTFHDLCVRHQFVRDLFGQLRKLTGLDLSVINAMYLGDPVHRAEASKVISALAQVVELPYTLETVEVKLLEQKDTKHE